MNNPIDGASGLGWPEVVESTTQGQDTSGIEAVGALEEDFAQILTDTNAQLSQSQGGEGASTDAVSDVFVEVARSLYHGHITDPGEAVHKVLEGVVSIRFSGLAEPARARMVDALQEVLIDDPFFVLEVEALLAQAMERF